MHGKGDLRTRVLQQTVGDGGAGTLKGFLARLEQPEERAAEVGFGGELLQYPEEYRRVHVVAAGVHDAGGA